MPTTVIDHKYMKQYFWRKYDVEDKGTTLISWDKVCKIKEQGGVGVLDMKTHTFFNKGHFITQRVLSITPGLCIASMHTTVTRSVVRKAAKGALHIMMRNCKRPKMMDGRSAN